MYTKIIVYSLFISWKLFKESLSYKFYFACFSFMKYFIEGTFFGNLHKCFYNFNVYISNSLREFFTLNFGKICGNK